MQERGKALQECHRGRGKDCKLEWFWVPETATVNGVPLLKEIRSLMVSNNVKQCKYSIQNTFSSLVELMPISITYGENKPSNDNFSQPNLLIKELY